MASCGGYNLGRTSYADYCPPKSSRNVSQFFTPTNEPKDANKAQHCVKTVVIDSRDRNPNSPGAFDFIIDVERDLGITPYEMVHSVELKMLAFPKVANEHYIVLDIAELNGQFDSTDNPCDAKFCVLFFDGYDSADQSKGMQPGDIKVIKSGDIVTRAVTFSPPIPRLSRLTVKVLKHGGSIVDPVADTGGVDTFSMILQVDTQSRSIH